MNDHRFALIVGNSDGIGLAATRALLSRSWRVLGISRSESPIDHESYEHQVLDVCAEGFSEGFANLIETRGLPEAFLYCAGIGSAFDPKDCGGEERVFATNLLGFVRCSSLLVPPMLKRGSGQILALSSLADELVVKDAPSYSASKAGLSSYLNGLDLALRKAGVSVTNIRFGFVDTKMAQAESKPLMITTERAAEHILRCLERRPAQLSTPKMMALLVRILRWCQRPRFWFPPRPK